MDTKVIGLSGPSGSGKSEAAKYLADAHGYQPVKFAFPLKTMLRAYYATQGLNPTEIERRIEGDLKEEPCEFLNGHTPRHAMETLGTEWGRICMGDTFWIEAWRRAAAQRGHVVVDDCRFDNEAEAIRAVAGRVIQLKPKVRRRKKSSHAAEAGLSPHLVDHVVVNDGTVQDLRDKISDIVDPPKAVTFGEVTVGE